MKALKQPKLRPVDNLTQVDKIEMSLQEYFRSENFQPGDSIPKETALAEAMGVSRTAVREAISRFRILGLIESRKNRGMIITQPDVLNNMERVMNPKLLDGGTMKEIFELRLVLEIGIGDLLFLRKNDANLAKLDQIVTKEENTQDKKEKLKYDVEFHSMLYKISGNDTILRFQAMLLPIFDYVYNVKVKSQVENNNYVTHRVLLNTLKNGTPGEFRNNMKNHLMEYFEVL
jgi:DNA-binding FadR family transcriptional regulator